jgi:hypothetical protein
MSSSYRNDPNPAFPVRLRRRQSDRSFRRDAMQGSSMAGRPGLASAGRDMLADWRRWSVRERAAALAVLAILAAIPAALFGGIP